MLLPAYASLADSLLRVLPVLHGTTEEVVWKICQKGMVNLSKLDDGFFGKGTARLCDVSICLSLDPSLVLQGCTSQAPPSTLSDTTANHRLKRERRPCLYAISRFVRF